MARVHPLVGTAIVFFVTPFVGSFISSATFGVAAMLLGFDRLAATVLGSFAILPLLWFWFIRWNLKD